MAEEGYEKYAEAGNRKIPRRLRPRRKMRTPDGRVRVPKKRRGSREGPRPPAEDGEERPALMRRGPKDLVREMCVTNGRRVR